ncbi:NAD-dependent succinate-semialdehyde dehydrogenase [Methanosarcina sp. UBA5]|uniref:NAD-dependent succinate-semialdehyde dehydrogenase n=1 Tax=Methanosarcina sp. UBA5 TaxID=1915593 RepID=UPI0025DB8FFE|nr:NAD-dependent succinate-semialdehyde dehydrogenase [Methanosarcina sp. UBA5]
MKFKSVNPYTEEINWTYDSFSFEDCEACIKNSRNTFLTWSSLPVEERTKYLVKIAEVLRKNTDIYAEIITKEMGKPIKQSRAEVQKCAFICDYYVNNAAKFLEDEFVDTGADKSYVTFEPFGVILGIMPWNFPFWQVFKFAIPAICAGNVCVLKHASNVPRSALEVEKVFLEAGVPDYVFKTLLIDSRVAMEIIKEEMVDGVSLTGSVNAGSEIGELAGKAIKPFVLELGGSDPFIVLEDADIEKAAQAAAKSRFLNTGQGCIAAKRFIVLENIIADFTKAFELEVNKLKIGNPMDEETDIGPVAKQEFVENLERILEDAKKKGAELLACGKVCEKGFFFRPTLIPAASLDMEACNVEVFGPIAPLITVKDEEEAVKIANSTEFGLGAEVWSRDLERAERLAKKIRAGFIAINGMVRSDPRMPFGGVKKSGIGRELSYYGIKEFVNVKTVIVNK